MAQVSPPPPPPRNGNHSTVAAAVASTSPSVPMTPASTSRAGYGGRVSYAAASPPSLYANTSSNGNRYNDYQANDSNMYAPSSSSSGMRQRKTDPGSANNNSNNNGYPQQQQQHLVQQYQEQRQSAQRLKEAVQAEKSLAALGTVFGKMSTLLQTQSETLTKIEDDVEAAQYDVQAGQEQISILYAIKKGNRPLILKVYALLIFLIVFMRFYVKK
jgi:hypothetical protein